MGLSESPTHFDLQQRLFFGAQQALGAPTFEARSAIMADTVADEASFLAARSLGMPPYKSTLLRQMFLDVCDDVNDLFKQAFTFDGKPIADNESVFTTAKNNASKPAYEALDLCFEFLGLEVKVKDLFAKVTFADALTLAEKLTNDRMPDGYTRVDVKQSLHETATGDHFEQYIDNLPFAEATESPLTADERKAFELAVRLANAAWKTSQIHRAVWERENTIEERASRGITTPLTIVEELASTKRIRPWGNEAFSPYDVWLKLLHRKTDKPGSDGLAPLSRTAFEIWKDWLELVKNEMV